MFKGYFRLQQSPESRGIAVIARYRCLQITAITGDGGDFGDPSTSRIAVIARDR